MADPVENVTTLPEVSTEFDEEAVIDPRSPDAIREEMQRRRMKTQQATVESLEEKLEEKLLKEAADARTIPEAELPPAWKRSEERKKRLLGQRHPTARRLQDQRMTERAQNIMSKVDAQKYYDAGKQAAGNEGVIVGMVTMAIMIGALYGGYRFYKYMYPAAKAAAVPVAAPVQ